MRLLDFRAAAACKQTLLGGGGWREGELVRTLHALACRAFLLCSGDFSFTGLDSNCFCFCYCCRLFRPVHGLSIFNSKECTREKNREKSEREAQEGRSRAERSEFSQHSFPAFNNQGKKYQKIEECEQLWLLFCRSACTCSWFLEVAER